MDTSTFLFDRQLTVVVAWQERTLEVYAVSMLYNPSRFGLAPKDMGQSISRLRRASLFIDR